jgi:hypothetical protein
MLLRLAPMLRGHRVSFMSRSPYARLDTWIDVRSGLAGGVVMGAAVFFINLSHGTLGASTAALKQFAYTFLMGSLIMRLCTALALRKGPDAATISAAIVVPSAVTIGATLFVHSLRGTPEPLLSTIPVAVVSPAGFAFWSRRVRSLGTTPWDRSSSSPDPVASGIAQRRGSGKSPSSSWSSTRESPSDAPADRS